MNEKILEIVKKVKSNPAIVLKGKDILENDDPFEEKIAQVVELLNSNGIEITRDGVISVLKEVNERGLNNVLAELK